MSYVYDKTIFTTLEAVTCASCGVTFGIETEHRSRLRENQNTFYCPNGHSMWYSKEATEAFKLKQDLENQKRVLEESYERNRRLQDQIKAEKIKTRAQKAAKTRMLNRVKNGVCPCCNRSFENLHRHMKTMHPDVKPEEYLPR